MSRQQQRQAKQARTQKDKSQSAASEPEVPEPKAERKKPEPKLDLNNVPPPFARGALTWPADERRSGRYGFIGLQDETIADAEPQEIEDAHLDHVALDYAGGKQVYLVLTVVAVQPVRAIAQAATAIGDRIVLGPGKLVWFEDPYSPTVMTGKWFPRWFGLMPDNPLKLTDWLDPMKLYRVLHQTVDVSILPV